MDLFQHCVTPWSIILNVFSDQGCQPIYQASLPTDLYSFTAYLPFYLKTFILELPIYFVFLRRSQSFTRILFICFILNLATHPIVFMALPLWFAKLDLSYLQYLVIAETFAPVTEAFLLRNIFKTSGRTSFWAALFANLFSWSVGVFWI